MGTKQGASRESPVPWYLCEKWFVTPGRLWETRVYEPGPGKKGG